MSAIPPTLRRLYGTASMPPPVGGSFFVSASPMACRPCFADEGLRKRSMQPWQIPDCEFGNRDSFNYLSSRPFLAKAVLTRKWRNLRNW
jgi:hypothetical protein